MKCEIITIGDEILIGDTVDTNSTWIAGELVRSGISTTRVVTISDRLADIQAAVDLALSRADLVLMTGGLGPTRDDVTKKALAEYFEDRLDFRPDVYAALEERFAKWGRQVNELNRSQADIPTSCETVPNDIGTAPGMWFKQNGRALISMPGVPYEMKHMMRHYILPRLKEEAGERIHHRYVYTEGVPESDLAEWIEPVMGDLPNGISLAYLPSPGRVKLRLTGKQSELSDAEADMQRSVDLISGAVKQSVYSIAEERMEVIVGSLLRNHHLTVGTAESCTGGYLAHLLTIEAGSSDFFRGSIVAYDNEVKSDLLDVDALDLEAHGAVSQAVVEQMATGARMYLKTDYALATSGVAGPGASEAKPVGMVWIAVAGPNGVLSQEMQFGKHRKTNIQRSAFVALNLLRKEIEKSFEN